MSDLRNDIQNMFAPPNRFSSFGQVLTRLRIIGFRSHVDTIIDISSPITAICGLNGTGKSTILHLAAVAYTGPRNYHISDFIRTSTLDPNPFTSRASVEYRYSQSPKDKVGIQTRCSQYLEAARRAGVDTNVDRLEPSFLQALGCTYQKLSNAISSSGI